MKRFLQVFSVFLLLFGIVACNKKVSITLKAENAELEISETFQIEYETNDKKGVIFESLDSNIAKVTEDGLVTAVNNGKTIINVISKTKEDVVAKIKITVGQDLQLELAPGMEHQLAYNKTNGYEFEVDNKYVAQISDEGLITASLSGETFINVKKDDQIVDVINIKVYEKAKRITLSGPTVIFNNEEVNYKVAVVPSNAFKHYKFIVGDDTIFEVTKEGNLIPKKPGTTTLTVKSLQDDETKDEIEITVKPVFVVNSKVDTLNIGHWTYKKGVDLFANIEEALNHVEEGSKLLLYNEEVKADIVLTKNIHLAGINSKIDGEVLIKDQAKEVIISDLTFINNSEINSNIRIKNIQFINNIVENITKDSFFNITNYENLHLANNQFTNVKTAINLDNVYERSHTLIEKNNINKADIALNIKTLERMTINSSIKIYRNKINDVNKAFQLDLANKNETTNSIIYARFNEVTNYQTAINHIDTNMFEYTFNYWDKFETDKFVNVDEKYLLEPYQKVEDILPEEKYNPEEPIKVILGNKSEIEEVWLGEEYQLDIIALPYTASKDRVFVAISNFKLVELTKTYKLVPIRSGEVELKVAAYSNISNPEVIKISSVTEPGILFDIDNPTYNLKVGDKFKVSAQAYPYNIKDKKVIFKTNNEQVAKVDSTGLVEIVGSGVFKLEASVDGMPDVRVDLEFEAVDQFDDNSLMDYLTQQVLTYSKMHEITLYGTEMAETIVNETATRVLIDNYKFYGENDHEWFLPKNTPGFRPGTPLNADIPEEFKFNDLNIVWIVVHDTGNSGVGAGANLHARYLYNQATQNGRKASWHYTVDSQEIYQHVPDGEIAYHAGDGSSKPAIGKQSPALGGGNVNGIGIEMSIQRDGHVYKTWQNTARLVAELLHKYNLPLSHQTYHYDFSGKECPQTLRKAGLVPLFEEMVKNEYELIKRFGNNFSVELISNNPEIIKENGMIITPKRSQTVSFDLKVTHNGKTETKTFNTFVEGLYR